MSDEKKPIKATQGAERLRRMIEVVEDSRPSHVPNARLARPERLAKPKPKPHFKSGFSPVRGKPHKVHPNSLAALEAHRGRTLIQHQPKCSKPGCRLPRILGSDKCRHHCPPEYLRKRREWTPTWRHTRRRNIWQQLFAAWRQNAFPPELVEQPVFRDLIAWALNPRRLGVPGIREPGGRAAARQIALARALAFEAVHAWLVFEEGGDPTLWHQVIVRAKEAGLHPITPASTDFSAESAG